MALSAKHVPEVFLGQVSFLSLPETEPGRRLLAVSADYN